MVIGIIVSWIAIGLLVGFIVSKCIDLHGDDPRLGVGASVAGAVVAAAMYSIISGVGLSVWNIWVMVTAAVGAAAAVVLWHLVRARYVSREPYTRRQSH